MEPLEDRRMLSHPHDPGGFDQGLLHTETDFARIAAKVAAQEDPWISGWQALTSEGYAQLGSNPRPLETVIRGGAGDNVAQMYIDIQRAYLLAVRWKVTGDTAYADKAVEFLNAWKDTMTVLTGNADRFLAAGIYGYQWANVAEIMRTYEGWSAADGEEFGDWLVEHFYQKNHDFLVDHNGAAITNYWANWDLCNIASMMAIGVYTDNQAMYDEAIDYLYNGGGNGALDKFVYFVHDGNLGQWQEAGRDQGHTVLGISLTGPIMQMAWNQGLDLFAYDNNRFAAGAEYVAKYNQGQEVDYVTYNWGTGQSGAWSTQPGISPAGRGAYAPGYELVYNHYANVKGIELPWVEQIVDTHYPEPWDRRGDQFGFGTLMYSLEPLPEGESKPSGLTAVNYEDTVKLNWWGAVYAESHNVYRAINESGPYTQIASGVSDLMTYSDFGMPDGQYFYKVTGVIDGEETAASNVVPIDTSPALVAHLAFNEGSGTAAADSTGNGVDGALLGGATWTSGVDGNAVDLSGGGQYVELPENVTEDFSDYTVATWVKLDTLSTWSRIFDLGNSDGRYMFLTPRAGSGNIRFALGTVYGYNENVIEGDAALPTGQWVHVAVAQSGRVGKLYVNGEVVGINDQMPLNAFQLGSTTQNWIGRSQYPGDPYLNGQVDDFRIYNGALSTGQVYQFATGNPPPAAPAAPGTLAAVAQLGNSNQLDWVASAGANYYAIKRAATPTGPFFTIDVVPSGTLTYSDNGLVAGQEYHYRVTAASNTGGESGPSPLASATALPPLPGAPNNLQGQAISATEIQLTWTAGSDAETYTIARSSTSGGSYTTIASGLTDTTFVDTGLSAGETFYYVVASVNAAGESVFSNEDSATVSDLRLWLKFDETVGALAADSSGGGWDGTLVNDPMWSAGRIENALELDGVDGYVELPAGVVSGLTDFTISTWVSGVGSANWTRIFDFGSGTAVNMFLTPVNGDDGDLRFAIKNGGGEQQINTSTVLPSMGWAHVAVTMQGGVGVLYVNGLEVGRNNSMTLTPADLGVTTQNYIGKSQYPDPYLDGRVDDFRILNRALSPADVMAMANLPELYGDYNGDGSVDAADYTVWRDNLGGRAPAFSGADGDGSGMIEAADYQVWKAHFGQTVAMPQPASLTAPIAALAESEPESAMVVDDDGFADFALATEAPRVPLRAAYSEPATPTTSQARELALLALLDDQQPKQTSEVEFTIPGDDTNEGSDLIEQIETYRRRFGFYPEGVHADKVDSPCDGS